MVASRARGSDANVICRRRRASLSAESSSLLKTRCRPLAARCLVLAACRQYHHVPASKKLEKLGKKNSNQSSAKPYSRYYGHSPPRPRPSPRALIMGMFGKKKKQLNPEWAAFAAHTPLSPLMLSTREWHEACDQRCSKYVTRPCIRKATPCHCSMIALGKNDGST